GQPPSGGVPLGRKIAPVEATTFPRWSVVECATRYWAPALARRRDSSSGTCAMCSPGDAGTELHVRPEAAVGLVFGAGSRIGAPRLPGGRGVVSAMEPKA